MLSKPAERPAVPVAAAMVDPLARLWPLPRAEDLVVRARRRAGAGDFCDTPFVDALQMLLRSCREEADLSLFGRFAIRWDSIRFLSNLARLRAEELRAPEILDLPIERPILIAGLPRSGTTFLHSLLAEDPANLVPRVWQLIHPYPARIGPDRRVQQVARQLRIFSLLAPEFRRLHPIEADSPQECSEITAHVFASLRFDTTYRIPSYRRWLDETGHRDAYRFHRRFLQHLQHQTGRSGQWVLKCPDHIFALPAIAEVYPDARFVFVHRDPLAVLLSVARLTGVLRRPFTRHIDKIEIGRDDSERWLTAAELMIAAATQQPFAEPILHVYYADLVREPLAAVAAIYRHFGVELTPGAAAAMRRLVAAKPDGGYGARRYHFAEHGLDAARERERFARYTAHFGIRPEVEIGPDGCGGTAVAAVQPSAAPAD
jgi:Sulfotransferase family